MKQEEFDEFKKNIAYMKVVNCSAATSCIFWREGNHCVFPGAVEIGGMGTCLSQSPPREPFSINPPSRKGARYLP